MNLKCANTPDTITEELKTVWEETKKFMEEKILPKIQAGRAITEEDASVFLQHAYVVNDEMNRLASYRRTEQPLPPGYVFGDGDVHRLWMLRKGAATVGTFDPAEPTEVSAEGEVTQFTEVEYEARKQRLQEIVDVCLNAYMEDVDFTGTKRERIRSSSGLNYCVECTTARTNFFAGYTEIVIPSGLSEEERADFLSFLSEAMYEAQINDGEYIESLFNMESVDEEDEPCEFNLAEEHRG